MSRSASTGDDVEIVVDGTRVRAPRGTTLAAVLLGRGELALRRSPKGEPRGPLCGMGICFECRVTVDGRPGVRACQLPVRSGMRVERADG